MGNPLSSDIQIYLQNYNIYLITLSNDNPFGKDLQFYVQKCFKISCWLRIYILTIIEHNRATISGIQTTIAVFITLTIQ